MLDRLIHSSLQPKGCLLLYISNLGRRLWRSGTFVRLRLQYHLDWKLGLLPRSPRAAGATAAEGVNHPFALPGWFGIASLEGGPRVALAGSGWV